MLSIFLLLIFLTKPGLHRERQEEQTDPEVVLALVNAFVLPPQIIQDSLLNSPIKAAFLLI